MSFPYKNPISSLQVGTTQSVPLSNTYGLGYSVNNIGGYMEVYSLNDLIYTIPTGTTGSIEYSGNTIPIEFTKGNGNAWSPDVLVLASDNISSGRRRLGMLVYVYDEDQVYQFHISGYTSLFTAATASTNCVTISEYGTLVKNNTSQGRSFINAWTASTIEDVAGYTSETAVWRKFNSGTGGGGSGFTSVRINNVSQFTSGSNSFINFSGVNVSISSVGTNTLVFSAGTGGGSGSSNLQYFITGSTPSGLTINSGDRWFDTNTGVEVVYINDGDSSQWVRPSNGMVPLFTGNTSATCITSLYVSNIYGCSPININDLVIANSGITTNGLTATTISATTQTISGTKGSVITSGSSTTAFITVSGSNTIGGTGYTDFIRVTNTAAGATNPNKTIRVNNTGGIEFLNSAYNALTFSIADNGIVTINSPASVTSNSAIDNALNVGTKGQLFDDGNLHIHSSTGSVWINSLDGSAIRLGTQTNSGNSPVIVDTTTVSHSFFTKVQSGFNVAFGTEITMDNLKVRINGTGGSGGLVQAGAVSGSFAAYTTLLGNVAGSALQGDTNSGGITFTTTYQNISGSQKTLSAGGDTTTLHLIDTTNSRIYRITAIHCQDTTGGYTSIERMV